MGQTRLADGVIYLPTLLYKNEFSTGLTGVERAFFLFEKTIDISIYF